MDKKNDNYFVSIEQEFLFDSAKNYKSRYTPWVYLYLKLEYNIFIHKKTSQYVKLKANEIKELFGIDKSTVYSCIKELGKDGLISKNKRDCYKIFSEKNSYRRKGNSKFIKVFKNQFIELFENGGSILEALTYYYMIQNNRHYAFESELLECDITQTQLVKLLHKDSRDIKNALNKLIDMGFIVKTNNKLYTKYYCENTKSIKKGKTNMETIELDPNGENLSEYIKYLINSGTKIKNVGWFKTISGTHEVRVINVPGYGNVVNEADFIDSDEIPPTEQEWVKSLELVKDNNLKIMTTVNVSY